MNHEEGIEPESEVVAAAQSATAMAAVARLIPRSFVELTEHHRAEFHQAPELLEHAPSLDEGVRCARSGLPYPCSQVREHGEKPWWSEVTDAWDRSLPGWRAHTCGVTDPDDIYL